MRSLFGPSRHEVWSQLAQRIGGDYTGSAWKSGAVTAQARDWTITLDTYTVSTGQTSITYTRMRAPFVNEEGFRFRITRAHLLTGLSTWLGAQDVVIGDAAFDRAYVVQSNDVDRIKSILASPRLRHLIQAQGRMALSIADDEGFAGRTFAEHVDTLVFQVHGVIKDLPRLESLFLLFAELLDEICHGARAYDDLPGRGTGALATRPPGAHALQHLDAVRQVVGRWGGQAEREGDCVVARVPSSHRGFDEVAHVTSRVPSLPTLTTDIVVDGALPHALQRVALAPKGLLSFSRAWTGIDAVDHALTIDAGEEVKPFLALLGPTLARLAPFAPRATIDEERLHVRLDDVNEADVEGALDALCALWDDAVRARLDAA